MLTPAQDKLYERFLTLQRVIDREITRCSTQKYSDPIAWHKNASWRKEREDACNAEVILQELLQAEVAISVWSTAKKFSVGANGESATIGPLGYRAWTH